MEIEQQWHQNQHEISEEEFVHVLNFLCNLQKPPHKRHLVDTPETFKNNYDDLTDIVEATEDKDELEGDLEELLQLDDNQPINTRKRKSVSLCQHKLQGPTSYRSRS